ncbi:MAG: hypothetical protein R2771_10345 [Saprospiraceae bacterium]
MKMPMAIMILLIGDVGSRMKFVKNGGDHENAFGTYKDDYYPSYDKAIDLNTFPGAFLLDVNFDDKPDLITFINITYDDPYPNTIKNIRIMKILELMIL